MISSQKCVISINVEDKKVSLKSTCDENEMKIRFEKYQHYVIKRVDENQHVR